MGRGGRKWLLFGKKGLRWLLKADFSKMRNRSAPLPNPLEVKPGPGELVVTDTENQVSINGGTLACAGTGTGTTWGDPAVQKSGAVDPDSGLAHCARIVSTDGAYICHLTDEVAKHSLLAPNSWNNASGTVTLPESVLNKIATTIRCSRHAFVLADGELLWVDDLTPPSAAYQPQVLRTRADYATALDLLCLLNLPANGYTEWERDGSEVTGSVTAAPDTTPNVARERAAATMSTVIAYDGSESAVNYRFTSASDRAAVSLKSDGALSIYDYKSSRQIYAEAGLFSAGNNYGISILDDGDTLTVWVDGVKKGPFNLTSSDASLTTLARLENYGSANATLTTHPYPALGPAYSRAICPQVGETLSMPSDALIRWENVKLPPAGEFCGFLVRYVDMQNYLRLRLYDTGKIRLYQVASGHGTTPAELADGTHTDGADITVRLNGGDAQLWSGTTNTSGTVSHTSGTILKDTGGSCGDRLACDEVAVWPIDMTRKLPVELWKA